MEDWCPTQGGNYRAYRPQYLAAGGDWRNVPVKPAVGCLGVPQPLACGGVNSTIGLYGYEQAMALAWQHAAALAAEGVRVEVRVQEYEVVYDIKARPIEVGE